MKAVFLDLDTLGPSDIDLDPLQALLPGLDCFATTNPGELPERIREAEIVILNKVRLDAAAIGNARKLRLICLAATGTDNICLETARERGITVCNIRDYCTSSVVQHVFALILALTQHISTYSSLLASGAWSASPQFCLLDYPIRELVGKTLGIVGLGKLGSAVAEVGAAFGMQIIAASHNGEERGTTSWPQLPLSELLSASDVLSLHCPLNEDTRHLIDADALRAMRRDALLINTARGGLVDAAALVEALRDERIAGAGIDVLEHEPPPAKDPLLDVRLPNLIVTPHIAWAAREARQRAVDQLAEIISAFLQDRVINRVA